MNAQGPISADSVRTVLDSILAQPAYAWQERRNPLAVVREWVRDLVAWLDQLGAEHPVAYFLLLFALTAVLVAILAHFTYLVRQALKARPEAPAPGGVRPGPVRDEAWHLRAFQARLAEGRYTEAMAERFAALVLQLGRLAAVRPDHSKTPAEYVVEARLDGAGRNVMTGLVDDLYLRLFGGAPCTAADVQRFDEAAGSVGVHVAAA